MAGQGNAKAGRLGVGDFELEAAWERLAGEIAHGEAEHEPLGTDPPGGEEAISQTEEQLRGYLERLAAKRASGFPPMETLTARLGEFSDAAAEANAADGRMDGITGRADGDDAIGFTEPLEDFAKFEHTLGKLKGFFSSREDEKREIVSINSKLAEILDRIDKLSASMPQSATLVSLESKLASVSQSLDRTRVQTAADARRISRAAEEIFAATRSAHDIRAGFEAATRNSIKELGKSMVVASTRAAFVTARQIGSALKVSPDDGAISRLESELRALNEQARENNDKTTAALDRIKDTLRTFLEASPTAGDSASQALPQKRRAGVHMPISADAPVYSRPGTEFGSAPASKPTLDTITLRPSPRPDVNFIRALQEADERMQGKDEGRAAKQEDESQDPARPPLFPRVFSEEERGLPLIGIGIVAFILLIASAVLYYLHTRTDLVPLHFSFTADGGAAQPRPLALPKNSAQVAAAYAERRLALGSLDAPALFASADQTGTLPASPPASEPEDLQAITEAARRGDADAQFRIGTRFLNEAALADDPGAAARWFEKAAAQGHAEAEFTLATLYERGQGVPKDVAKAIDLYRRAAAGGHVLAMHNLGVLLAARDTAQDYREAARWFAQANLPESQYNLALLYERGLGVRQDLTKAYALFKAAARSGDSDADAQADRLKRLLQAGDVELSVGTRGWRPAVEGTWQVTASRS